MKGEDVHCLNELSHAAAYSIEYITVPLHRGAGRQQRGKSLYRLQAFNVILAAALNPRYGTKLCLHLAVAWSLAAPRTSVDKRLTVNYPDYRVVVIHKVTIRNVPQPVANLGTLSRTALCYKSIAVATVTYKRGMDEQRLLAASGKGEDEHQSIVESESPHVEIAIQRTCAVFKIITRLQQATLSPIDILYDELVFASRKAVNNGFSVPRIKLSYSLPVIAQWLQGVINNKSEKRFISPLAIINHKWRERGNELFAVKGRLTEYYFYCKFSNVIKHLVLKFYLFCHHDTLKLEIRVTKSLYYKVLLFGELQFHLAVQLVNILLLCFVDGYARAVWHTGIGKVVFQLI